MSALLLAILAADDAQSGLASLQRSLNQAQAAYDRAAATAEKRQKSPDAGVRQRAQEAATAALDVLDEWRSALDKAQAKSAGLDQEKAAAIAGSTRLMQQEPAALQQHRNCHAGR